MRSRHDIARLLVLPALALGCVAGCHGNREPDRPPDAKDLKEKLIRVNKQFVLNQLDDIDGYIEIKGYTMDSTATGLRYRIQAGPGGRRPGPDDAVTLNYRTSLLDGRHCYSSDSLGTMDFSMNYDEVPNGLREGVAMMAEGDKALLIIPSHLAYGLTGDGGCIPPNAALVMQVELVRVK